ncbi:MAG: DUF2079 domain-containing protein, partial [Planctomycetes bacterium]|nr:DUF2079 domain-containing protein [Planctomycetota bacterium]
MMGRDSVPRVQSRGWHVALLALVLLYAGLFTALNVLRYRAFFCTEWEDLAVRNQMLWNAAHGRLWTQSIFCFPHPDHFEPIEFLLVPFYWLRPHVTTLFALQSLALGLGAVPIFLIARREFVSVADSAHGEGEAPAEPHFRPQNGSAGASPSQGCAFRSKNEFAAEGQQRPASSARVNASGHWVAGEGD